MLGFVLPIWVCWHPPLCLAATCPASRRNPHLQRLSLVSTALVYPLLLAHWHISGWTLSGVPAVACLADRNNLQRATRTVVLSIIAMPHSELSAGCVADPQIQLAPQSAMVAVQHSGEALGFQGHLNFSTRTKVCFQHLLWELREMHLSKSITIITVFGCGCFTEQPTRPQQLSPPRRTCCREKMNKLCTSYLQTYRRTSFNRSIWMPPVGGSTVTYVPADHVKSKHKGWVMRQKFSVTWLISCDTDGLQFMAPFWWSGRAHHRMQLVEPAHPATPKMTLAIGVPRFLPIKIAGINFFLATPKKIEKVKPVKPNKNSGKRRFKIFLEDTWGNYTWQFWVSTGKIKFWPMATRLPRPWTPLQNLGLPCREAKGKRFCPRFNGTSLQLSFWGNLNEWTPWSPFLVATHSIYWNLGACTSFWNVHLFDVCIIAWAITKARERALNLCNIGKWWKMSINYSPCSKYFWKSLIKIQGQWISSPPCWMWCRTARTVAGPASSRLKQRNMA